MTVLMRVAFALIAAGVLLAGGAYLLRNGPAALTWDQAEGTIVGHTVEALETTGEPLYRSVASYSYRVEGVLYIGNRLPGGPSEETGLEGDAGLFSDYPVGSTVAVLYDGRDPGNAVVDRGMSLFVLVLVMIGGYLAALGAMLFGYGYLRGR